MSEDKGWVKSIHGRRWHVFVELRAGYLWTLCGLVLPELFTERAQKPPYMDRCWHCCRKLKAKEGD